MVHGLQQPVADLRLVRERPEDRLGIEPAAQLALRAIERELEAGVEEVAMVEDDRIVDLRRLRVAVRNRVGTRGLQRRHDLAEDRIRGMDSFPVAFILVLGIGTIVARIRVVFVLVGPRVVVVRPGTYPRQCGLVGLMQALEAIRVLVRARGIELRRIRALHRALVGVFGETEQTE